MSKVILSIACLLLVSSAQIVQLNHEQAFKAGQVNIQSDNGVYLARCNGCGPGTSPDSATIHETNPNNTWALWTISQVGDKISFRADSGNFLSRCNGCWLRGATFSDSATVHVTDASSSPWAQWTPEDLGNGKWAFKADSGKYLARCENCVTGGITPNYAFVYADSSADPKAQWTVTWRFPDGKVSLQADFGNYLKRCTRCRSGGPNDSASVSDSTVTPRSTWTIEKVGNKVSFKSDSGNYLARCDGCWSGVYNSGSAAVHA